jgi:tRNA (guanine-N(7)-)-methyltransferase subunit TRM82
LEYIQTVRLLGNVLAVLTDIPNNGKKTTNRSIVSVDTAHYPGSTWELNNKTEDLINPLQTFQFQNGRLMEEPELVMALNEDEATGTGEVANADVCGQLSDLLYNIENLRKRDGEGQEE